jgi:predicted RNA-binding Zn-ribbon protein involved in translation (DUF1610 family)
MNGDIPKIFACPTCGEAVSGFESECPRCKKRFDASVKFDCPFCGESVIAGSISCPSCHVDFEEVTAQPAAKPKEKSVEELLTELQNIGNGKGGKEPPTSECPRCGANVPTSVEKCPICSMVLVQEKKKAEPIAPKPAAPAASFEVPSSLTALIKEQEPEVEWACPNCGKEVGNTALQCPHCKTVFEAVEEEDQATAPEISEEEQAIEKLTGLLELVKEPKPKKTRKLKPKPDKVAPLVSKTPPRAMASARGRINGTGLVNGRGAVNGRGLVNGKGAVNGRGLVNGKGAINGKGLASTRGETNGKSIAKGTEFVNGTGVSNGIRPRRSSGFGLGGAKRMVLKWQFLAVIVVISLVIATFVYLSYSRGSSAYTVDGDLNDWNHATVYSAKSISSSPGISVDRWSFDTSDSSLYFYVRTQGAMMNTEQVESVLLYVDEDDSTNTGYLIDGIGADFLLTVDGWNGSVQSTSISQYGSQTDHLNWNLWTSFSSLKYSMSSNQLEASALLSEPPSTSAKAILVYKDEMERESASQPVPIQGSLLVVEQKLLPSLDSTGIVASSTSSQLLRLNFTCEGDDGSVTSVSPSLTGCVLAGQIQSFSIAPGETVIRDISVDTTLASAGQAVSAAIVSSSVQSSFDSVKVIGEAAKAYVESVPGSIVIDGAFGDWASRTSIDSDIVPVQNQNVDIDEVGAGNDTDSAYFYVSVKGDICYGSFAPFWCAKPSGGGGGGGPVTPPRRTAEDITRIYMDTDSSTSTGYPMTYDGKSIGADSLVEIKGLFGEIVSAVPYSYMSGTWTLIPGTVEAENDDSQLEVGVPASSLDGALSPEFVIETTSWNSRGDYGIYDPSTVMATMQSVFTPPDVEHWAVETSTTSSAATAMSYQRKLFYDGTNFWSFYYDGTNTVYRYSTDSGVTWSSKTSAFTTSGVNEVSIWFDSGNNAVYAVGDTSTASTNVYVRKGTVNPGGHSISWGTQATPAVSSNNLASKNAFISRDVNGYLWLLSNNYSSTSPERYQASVFKSTSVNSVASWAFSGQMLQGQGATISEIIGSVVPAGTGSDVWAVVGWDGNVASRKYTTSWSNQQNILSATGSAKGNTAIAPPCVVVDSKKVVHVVYGDCNEDATHVSKPRIWYIHNNTDAVTWTTALALDSQIPSAIADIHPVISLDSSNDDLYAFWIRTDSSVVGTTIMGKQYSGGSWTNLTFEQQNSYPKQHLTSVYSAPGQYTICWQWTQNTSSPIHVIFDHKIPEFGQMTYPVLLLIALVPVMWRKTRKPVD